MLILHAGDGVDLRECTPGHAGELFSLIEFNRKYLREWLPWLDETTKLSQVDKFLREARRKADNGDGQIFLVFVAGRIAGVIGEHYVDRIDRKTEIGYWLDSRCQGRGVMTRAASRMVEHIFADLNL